MRRSQRLILVAPSTYPSHPHRWVTAQGSNSSFHHCSACGAARFDYKLKLATRLQLERRPLRCPHLHGRTAQRCVRAAMRSPSTDGTAFGVGVCRRRDLTLFVTQRQILTYWGCGYSTGHSGTDTPQTAGCPSVGTGCRLIAPHTLYPCAHPEFWTECSNQASFQASFQTTLI